ncbi:ABC transporter substrate-binding protein [Lederbergia citrea]|uniref:ABC transporter substrate-binding protein n=1 Tax=Lederbergia citrea TaxID=2833581 RepID=UPI0020163808|nr:ABC transporter substrate-binding protein [Lederbergia citrea]
MKKTHITFAFISIFCLLLVGCSGGNSKTPINEAHNPNQLIYASESEYENLNPILEETNLDALIFRGLFRFDENNEPKPDIAESYTRSNNGLTYTIKLKKGITFHDGKPLTADDAAFTINAILDDHNASFLKADFNEIKSVENKSDEELIITLKEPFTPLLDKLTVPILPKHAFEGQDMRTAPFNQKPIGAGPYKFEKWDKGNSLTLKAYDHFFGTAPSIETVIFKFIPDSNVRALQLQSGEVDIALLDPVQAEKLKELDNLQIYDIPTADYRAILYNLKKDLWKDVNVRKAFNYAINRSQLVSGLLKGYGKEAYSPLQVNEFHNENIEKYEYNPKKAEQLLDVAGWKKEEDGFRYKNGEKLAFTITSPVSDTVRVNMANYAAEEFKKIGADVSVDALDWSVISIEDSDAFMIGWGSPYDADHHTYILFHADQSSLTSTGYNFGSYSNAKVDKLLEQGRTITDSTKRKAIYQDFQQQLANDPAYNFMAYVNAIYGLNKNITGISERTLGHHGSGFLWNVEEWKWNDR